MPNMIFYKGFCLTSGQDGGIIKTVFLCLLFLTDPLKSNAFLQQDRTGTGPSMTTLPADTITNREILNVDNSNLKTSANFIQSSTLLTTFLIPATKITENQLPFSSNIPEKFSNPTFASSETLEVRTINPTVFEMLSSLETLEMQTISRTVLEKFISKEIVGPPAAFAFVQISGPPATSNSALEIISSLETFQRQAINPTPMTNFVSTESLGSQPINPTVLVGPPATFAFVQISGPPATSNSALEIISSLETFQRQAINPTPMTNFVSTESLGSQPINPTSVASLTSSETLELQDFNTVFLELLSSYGASSLENGVVNNNSELASSVSWNSISTYSFSNQNAHSTSNGNSFIKMTNVLTVDSTIKTTSQETFTSIGYLTEESLATATNKLTAYDFVSPTSKDILSSYETFSSGNISLNAAIVLYDSVSTATNDIISSYGRFSSENSFLFTNMPTDIRTVKTLHVETLSTDVSVLASDVTPNFSKNESESYQQTNATSMSCLTQTHDNIIPSVGVTNSFMNSTSGNRSQSTENTFTPIDGKVWAIPVIAGLSVLLFITWLILILACRKMKARRSKPSRVKNSQKREDLQQENESNIKNGARSWQEPSLQFSTNNGTQVNETARENPISGHSKESGTNFKSPGFNEKDFSNENNEALELENMSSTNGGIFPSHSGYSPLSHHEELRYENETSTYDNYSFNSKSPEASPQFLGNVRIIDKPIKQDANKEFKEVVRDLEKPKKFNQSNGLSEATLSSHGNYHTRPQQTNMSINSIDNKKNLHFQTFTSPNQKFKNEKEKENNFNQENMYYARLIFITESKISYTDQSNEEKIDIELKQFSYDNQEDNFVPEYQKDNEWVDNDNDNEKYMYYKTGVVEDIIMDSGNNRRMNIASLDVTESVAMSSKISERKPENPEKITRNSENRPNIYKCVSFDDTQLHKHKGKITRFNKNSDSRKISTTSESAASYLTLPEEGFPGISTAYKTLDNLAEIGDSPVGSQFFIGLPSDKNFLGNRDSQSPKCMDDDEINNQTINATGKDVSKNEDNKNTQYVPKTNEDHHKVAQKDNYVFPIAKKANFKILAERQQRKIPEKSSSNSSEERLTLTAAHPWKKIDGNRKLRSNLQKEETATKIHNMNPLSSTILMNLSSVASKYNQKPSLIPKIILTQDKNENEERSEKKSEEDITPIVPSRSRRIARANNPFLIEVDPPKLGALEKVRRSSAPSMAHDPSKTQDTLATDGMIRSVSGDRLYEHFRKFEMPMPKFSSTEFFDLIKKTASNDPSEDNRLKKMINERYDALFYNKNSLISSPDVLSRRPDLSPEISRRLTEFGRILLPNDTTGITCYSGTPKHGEQISPFRPIIEDNEALYQSGTSKMTSNSTDDNKNISKKYSNPQTVNITGIDILTHEVTKRNDSKTVAMGNTNYESDFHSPCENKIPRPSLTRGTDGQDSDAENQKAQYVEAWLPNSEAIKEKPHPFARNTNINNGNGNRKLPISAVRWESFEDDFEKAGLHSNTSKSSSQKPRFVHNSGNSQKEFNLKGSKDSDDVLRISERSRLEKEKAGLDIPIDDKRNFSKHSGQWEDGIIERRNSQAWESIDNSYPFLASEIYQGEQEQISPLPIPRSPPPVLSYQKRASFDDNFDINAYIKTKNAQSIHQKKENTNSENQLCQDITNKISQIKSLNAPERPPRKASKRGSRKDKFERPLSPHPLTKNKIKDFPAEKEQTSREEELKKNEKPDKTNVNAADPSKINFHHTRSARSLSLEEFRNVHSRRTQRATTLATDKLQIDAKDWFKLFDKEKSRFMSSASNTLLEHAVIEEPLHEINSLSETIATPDLPQGNSSFSEPEFKSPLSAISAKEVNDQKTIQTFEKHNTGKNANDRKSAKLLIPSDDFDDFLQVSDI